MDDLDEMLVEVRASTRGFQADVQAMRASFDSNLTDGFAKAGNVLERGLLSAIRKGSLGFDDLKNAAFSALDQIAAQALRSGLGALFGSQGGGGGGGIGGIIGSLAGSALGLPGRATGGPVAPGRGYLVGERGPEVFVPTSAGRVETGLPGQRGRDVRVAITLAPERGASSPRALERSGRQVASAIRRSLRES